MPSGIKHTASECARAATDVSAQPENQAKFSGLWPPCGTVVGNYLTSRQIARLMVSDSGKIFAIDPATGIRASLPASGDLAIDTGLAHLAMDHASARLLVLNNAWHLAALGLTTGTSGTKRCSCGRISACTPWTRSSVSGCSCRADSSARARPRCADADARRVGAVWPMVRYVRSCG